MALRFQKRITLFPGVRLNVSKGGLSVSAGPRGASITAGKRGMYANAGLPGTGISFREKLGAGAQSRVGRGTTSSPSTGPITMAIDPSGECSIYGPDAQILTGTPLAKVRKHHGDSIRQYLQQECTRLNAATVGLSTLHVDTPTPSLNPSYNKIPFDQPKPTQGFWARIFAMIISPIAQKHQAAINAWEVDKVSWEAREQSREVRETVDVFTSLNAMQDTLTTYLSLIPWPMEPEIAFDFGHDVTTLDIDISMPCESEMPANEWSTMAKQYRLNMKPLSDTRRRQLYSHYVHAIIFRVAGEIFARLPRVDVLTVSGSRAVIDGATGADKQEYILSIKVSRQQWSHIDFDRLALIDPIECMNRFETRSTMSKTGIFKSIEPFG